MVCDTGRHRPPAPASLDGAVVAGCPAGAGAARATAATSLTVATTDLRRRGIVTAVAARRGSGDDGTTGDEADDREADAAWSAKAMSLATTAIDGGLETVARWSDRFQAVRSCL
jgi:hypothetical protein